VDPSINITIFEFEDTLGGTWAASRIFPDLLTQQGYGYYEASDLPFERADDPPQPGDFIPSQRVHEYLTKYAETWHVKDKIRFGTAVERCQRALDGIKWEVYVRARDTNIEERWLCDKLIIATGLTSQPNIPDIPSEDFTPLTIHSRYLGEHYNQLQSDDVRAICVYGGGKSAYDTVTAAVRNGCHVHWIIRPSESGGGMTAFFTPEAIGKYEMDRDFIPLAEDWQPNIRLASSWFHWWLHHGWFSGDSWLCWCYWKTKTRKLLDGWKYDENENTRKLKPEIVESR
jgi:dimethylaniline monooxygenase (N-oxide forming)